MAGWYPHEETKKKLETSIDAYNNDIQPKNNRPCIWFTVLLHTFPALNTKVILGFEYKCPKKARQKQEEKNKSTELKLDRTINIHIKKSYEDWSKTKPNEP